MDYENPQPYAAAAALETAPSKACPMRAAYPLASAALMGVLIEMDFSPLATPINTPAEWATHYAARLAWVSGCLEYVSGAEKPAHTQPAALLECWLAQNPAVHIAQWIEAVADGLRVGDITVSDSDIDAPADVCAVFTDMFALYMAEEWDDNCLIQL